MKSRTTQILVIALAVMAFVAVSLYAGDQCPASSKSKAETSTTSAQSTCAKTCGSKAAAKCSAEEMKACGATMAKAQKPSKLTLGVAYLSCNGCATHVGNALKGVSGVQSVAVDYRTGTADVEYDAASVTSGDLIKAIETAGYHAQVGPYSDKEIMDFAKGGKPATTSVSVTPAVKSTSTTDKAGSE